MKKTCFLFSLLVLFSPALLLSQVEYRGVVSDDFRYRIQDFHYRLDKDFIGPRGLAMGGAQIAAVNDITGVYFNPASLANLQGLHGSVSGRMNFDSQDHHQPPYSGFSARTDVTPLLDLNSAILAYALPLGSRTLAVGIGYRYFIDMNNKMSTNHFLYGGGRYKEVERMSGGVQAVSPTLAFDVLPSLSVGVTYNHLFGKSDFDLKIMSPYADETVYFEFKDGEEYSGSNLELGFHARVTDWLQIGGIYSPKWSYTVEEKKESMFEYDFQNQRRDESKTPEDELATVDFKIPAQFGFGLAVNPFRLMTLAFDVRTQSWSKITATSNQPAGLKSMTKLYDTTSWYFGVEQIVPGVKWQVPLRIGVFQNQTPYRDKEFKDNYEGEQIVQNGWSLGLGARNDRLSIDLAFHRSVFKFGWWMTSSDYYNQRMFETIERYNHVVLSITYKI